MHFRARTWFVIIVLCLLGALLFWRVLDRPREDGLTTTSSPTPAPGPGSPGHNPTPTPPTPTAAANATATANAAANLSTNDPNVRLSNTTKSVDELLRSEQGLLLRNALIDSSVPVNLPIPAHLRSVGDPGSYVVQAKGAVTDSFRELLQQAGASIVAYVPNNAFLVRANAEVSQSLAASPQVQHVLAWEPYFKFDSQLLPVAVQQQSLPDNAQLNLLLFPGEREQLVQALTALDGAVLAEDRSPFGPILRVRAPRDTLVALAQLPAVQTLELYHQRVLLNDLARDRLLVATNTTAATFNYRELDGLGILVNVNDTGVEEDHPDLSGKVFGLIQDNDGHGTHVAGTIASSGANSPAGPVPGSRTSANFRGIAYNANIFALSLAGSDSFLQETPAKQKAFISNNSWSYGGSHGYTVASASWDAAVRDAVPEYEGSQPLLVVFAAGNSGSAGIDAPGTAKNVLTVGALKNMRNITNEVIKAGETNRPWFRLTDTNNEVPGFSAQGNVDRRREGESGRFKPDVVAPGTFTVSTRSTTWVQPTNRIIVISEVIPAVRLKTNDTKSFSALVPDNAINVEIILSPNQESGTNGVPPLGIYVEEGFAPTPPAGFMGTNRVSFDPRPGVPDFWFWTIENLNTIEAFFDVHYHITVTNDVGNEPEVFFALNEKLAPYYRYETGTSMSAPAVSGMLALMQQYYEQRLSLTNSPALMKALVINGARSVNSRLYDYNIAPISNFQGWGLPALTNSLPVSEAVLPDHVVTSGTLVHYDQDLTRGLKTGDSFTRIVTLSSNATVQSLRFTLVWTDPPGSPAVGIKLVNDLDLIVTNLVTHEVFVGNLFGPGDVSSIGQATNATLISDRVNNVENVYFEPGFGSRLDTSYSVTVFARRVNVNAASANTNGTMQDFALVISSGQPRNDSAAITVTDQPLTMNPLPTLTQVTNGVPLLNQRAGAQNPFLVMTNGTTNQWRFFVVTNELPPSDPLFGNPGAATNIAFLTFLPPNLSLPRVDEADIDMYVSSDVGITNLDPAVLDKAFKSRKRTGTESVVLESEANGAIPGAVFYAAVKSEDQQAANFAFFAISSSSPFGSQDTNGNVVIIGYPANVEVPDGDPADPQAGFMFAFSTYPMVLQNVVVTNDLFHENGGDLFGSLSHDTATSVLNANRPFAGFREYIYDDSDSGEIPISGTTDPPGTLRNFVGEEGLGAYILTMVDSIPFFTGQVQRLAIQLQPRKDELTNEVGITETIRPGRWFYTVVDVPADATNLAVCVSPDVGPLEVYIQRGAFPDRITFDTRGIVIPPGDCVNLGLRDFPPLSQGRYYIGIFNPNNTPVTANIKVRIERNLDLKTKVGFGSGGSMLLLDDALTNAIIHVGQRRTIADLQVGVRISHPRSADLVLHLISPKGTRVLLAENRGGAYGVDYGFGSLQTNVAPATATGDAVPHTNTVGPLQVEGTVDVSYDFFNVPDRMTIYYDGLLIFDSGLVNGTGNFTVDYGPGQATNVVIVMNESGGLGGTAWNYVATIYSGYHYAIFTEDTTLAKGPIKFEYPPFTNYNYATKALVTNTVLVAEGFDNIAPQCAPPAFPIGTILGGFEVFGGSVNVLSAPCGFLSASHSGLNLLDLDGDSPGAIRRDLNTTPGNDYVVSFVYTKAPVPDPKYGLFTLTGLADTVLTADQQNTFTDLMWRTNVTRFTATAPVTTMTFQSLQDGDFVGDGLFLDTIFVAGVETKTNFGIYFLPEEPMSVLRGENSFGDWRLELWDNRAGAVLTNALLGWKLNLTFVNTNPPAYTLTNGIPFCTKLGSNEVIYLKIEVPITASAATNVVIGTEALDLVYNQLGEPSLREPPDTFFLRDVLSGYAILSDTGWNSFEVTPNGPVLFDASLAPTLRPGQRYYLAVRNRTRNTNNVCVTITFDQLTPNLAGIIPLTNNVCAHFSSAPDTVQYYSFDVSSNALGVIFEIPRLDNNVDLYVKHGLPLPNPGLFDTNSINLDVNPEFIEIDDFFHRIAGRWYLAVTNLSGDQAEYDICAREIPGLIPKILPDVVYPGIIIPSNTVQYFQVEISSNVYLADFVLTNLTGTIDLYLSTNTMTPLFRTPINAMYGPAAAVRGPNTEIIKVSSFAAVNPLTPGTWFIAVDNRDPVTNLPFDLFVHQYTTNLPYLNLTNGLGYSDQVQLGDEVGLYRFEVPPNAIQATFELYGLSGDADLFVSYNLPLPPPGPARFLYASTNRGTANEYLCLTTNGPLVLQPGSYFIGVRAKNPGDAVAFTIRATRIMSSDVTPLVNGVVACGVNPVVDPNVLYTGVRFFSINVPRRAIQGTFELLPAVGDVDMYIQKELPLTNFTAYPKGTAPYPYPGDPAESPGLIPEARCVRPTDGPVPLGQGTWFVTVVNRDAVPAQYCLRASVISDTNLVRLQSGQAEFGLVGPTNGGMVAGISYYVFNVATNPWLGTFETFGASGNVDLFVTRDLCLPNFATYDPALAPYPYAGVNPGRADEFICLATNTGPVKLQQGDWYLAVVNRDLQFNTFQVRATQLFQTNFIRINNSLGQCRQVKAGSGGLGDGVDYFVVNIATNTVNALFETYNANGNVDLFVSRDPCLTNLNNFDPLFGTYPYFSVNPDTTPECISVSDFSSPVPLTNGDWYVAVLNKSAVPVDYCLAVTQFTNNPYTRLAPGLLFCGELVPPDNGQGGIGVSYYSFVVTTNMLQVTFDVTLADQNVDLYVSPGLCFPNRDRFGLDTVNASYASTNGGLSNESICVQRNSTPTPLRPGLWYAAVVNREPLDGTATYCIQATALLESNILQLTNRVPFALGAPTLPNVVDNYRYRVSPNAVQLNVEILQTTANVDLYVQRGFCPTNLASFTYGSFNPGTNTEFIAIATNSVPEPLSPGDWFIAVYNADNTPADYTIRVTEILASQIIRLTNAFPYSNNIVAVTSVVGSAVQYYVYNVTTNAVRAQFEIRQTDNDVNLYAGKSLPLPTPGNASFHSANENASPELISVLDTSVPIPLSPGDWFLTVTNASAATAHYLIVATEFRSRGDDIDVSRVWLITNSLCITWVGTLAGVNYYVVGKAEYGAQAWLPVSDTIRATGPSLTWCTPLPTPYMFFDLREGLSPLSLDNPVTMTNSFASSNGLTLCWTAPPNRLYGVYYSDSLFPLYWKPYPDYVTSATDVYKFTDDGTKTGGMNTNRYYQVILLTPP